MNIDQKVLSKLPDPDELGKNKVIKKKRKKKGKFFFKVKKKKKN